MVIKLWLLKINKSIFNAKLIGPAKELADFRKTSPGNISQNFLCKIFIQNK